MTQLLTRLPQDRGDRSLFPPIQQIKDPEQVKEDVDEIMHELSMRYIHKFNSRVKDPMDFATERAAWARLCMSIPTDELQQAFLLWFSSSNEKKDWPPVPADIDSFSRTTCAYHKRKNSRN